MPNTEINVPNYKVRILTPKVGVENIESLKDNRPFLMRAQLELGAKFIQTAALPTLVDMLGFSGSGGAPAYGFLVGTGGTATKDVLFISLAPNTPIYLPDCAKELDKEKVIYWESLGITMAMGALLAHFMLDGPGVAAVIAAAEEEGAVVVDMMDYDIPGLLKQKILPSKLEQMAAKP
jgi:hypothetical protein